MIRRAFFTGIAVLAASLRADYAQGNSRLTRLYGMFMAPCCWRENLLVHRSPEADELRTTIQNHIRLGWTDEQIKAWMIGKYRRRILTMPEGSSGDLLRFMPMAAITLGAGLVSWVITRSLRHQQAPAGPAPANLPDLDESL